MVSVDQLMGNRGCARQDTEPTKRVNAFKQLYAVTRYGLARYTVEAIATGNVVAVDMVTRSLVREANRRMVAVRIM